MSRLYLTGIRRSKGVMRDTGRPYDSVTAYCNARIAEGAGGESFGVGFAGVSYPILLSAYTDALAKVPYTREGVAFECEIEPVATGRNAEKVETIVKLELIKSQPAQPAQSMQSKPSGA